jgi:glucosylceramidase
MDVAFRNPDGSTALVVHNENDDPRSFAVSVGERLFEYALPGGALATFTWPADRALLPPPWTGMRRPRWSSGTALAPGQYLQVDLGRATTLRRVAIDSGGNIGDYARGGELAVSDNGTDWRILASGFGVGQLTTVDVPRTRARYLRITSTASAGNWWRIADVRLYADITR